MATLGDGTLSAKVEAGVWSASASFALLDVDGQVFGRVEVGDLAAVLTPEQAELFGGTAAAVITAVMGVAQSELGVTFEGG